MSGFLLDFENLENLENGMRTLKTLNLDDFFQKTLDSPLILIFLTLFLLILISSAISKKKRKICLRRILSHFAGLPHWLDWLD